MSISRSRLRVGLALAAGAAVTTGGVLTLCLPAAAGAAGRPTVDTSSVDTSSVKIVHDSVESSPGTDTYRLDVTSGGEAAEHGVTVSDRVPAGTAYAGCVGGTSCTGDDGTVQWHVGPTQPGSSTSVGFTVTRSDR